MFTKLRTGVENFFQEEISTDQCENLSDSYFSAAETGGCDFVQKCFGPGATFITECVLFVINGACASLKEACTVVLHSGLCPSHTNPLTTTSLLPPTTTTTTTAMFH